MSDPTRFIHCDSAHGAGRAIDPCKATTGDFLFPRSHFVREAKKHQPHREPTAIKIQKTDEDQSPIDEGSGTFEVGARVFCPICVDGPQVNYAEQAVARGLPPDRWTPKSSVADSLPGTAATLHVEFDANQPWRQALIDAAGRSPNVARVREQAPRRAVLKWHFFGDSAKVAAEQMRNRLRVLPSVRLTACEVVEPKAAE